MLSLELKDKHIQAVKKMLENSESDVKDIYTPHKDIYTQEVIPDVDQVFNHING